MISGQWLVVGEMKICCRWDLTKAGVKAWDVSAGQFNLAKRLQMGPIFCAGTRKK